MKRTHLNQLTTGVMAEAVNTKDSILEVYEDYEACRAAKSKDPAWALDDGSTNYRLEEGDTVILRCSTVADGALLAPGTVGTVADARTPRVRQPVKRKPRTYIYFANVDFIVDGVAYRGRVPHNALKRRKQETAK